MVMIKDLSLTLREVLQKSPKVAKLEPLKNADIIFAPPADNLNRVKPTVSIFLYDIRENLELRNNDTVKVFNNGQYQLTYPPKAIDCSYLITAWSDKQQEESFLEEQDLLGQVLQVLSGYNYIPESCLHGILWEQEQKIPVTLSHLDNLKTIGEFWSAIGGKLRTSISVTLTITLEDVLQPIEAPLVSNSGISLSKLTDPNSKETWFRIRGKITDNSEPPLPIPKAKVSLLELNLKTMTDEHGCYTFSNITVGTYTLKAEFKTQSGSVSEEKQVRILSKNDPEWKTYPRNYDLKLNVQPAK